MKEDLIKELQQIVKNLTGKEMPVALSIPNDSKNGDWAANVAFQLGKELGMSPFEAAQKVVSLLEENGLPAGRQGKYSGIVKAEAVAPGFINFYLTNPELKKQVHHLLEAPDKAGKTEKMAGKKIMVEFTDPNPFKEFHIGHLYSNIVGESLARLVEAQGAEVKRVTYQGDVGLHVAKSLWGVMHMSDQMPDEAATPGEKAAFLGKAYALGAAKYEEDAAAKAEIVALNKKVYTREDEAINKLYDMGKQWSLTYFQQIYDRLGSDFWKNYFESEAGPKGMAIVKDHISDGIFEEHDGAVVFRAEEYGLHTRVFINSMGLPTYEAKELGLAPTKYADYPYDISIIVTGNEINAYFKVLLQALSLINPDLASKTKHISHGMVRLPEGKMSSRTGNVITGEWLLDEACKKAGELSGHSLAFEETEGIATSHKQGEAALSHAMKPSEVINITEKVGIGAVKYAFLKSSVGKDIEFDFATSLSLNGNSGPYVQYTYTRTQSVLGKAHVSHPGEATTSIGSDKEDSIALLQNDSPYQPQKEETDILRKLYHFSEIVEEAASSYSPNVVTEYLFELSQLFNNFYQKYRILNAPSEGEKAFRLGLTQATGIVLKKGLNLLGIQAPEKM